MNNEQEPDKSRDKLRNGIAKTLFDWIDDDGWEWWEVDEAVKNHYRHKADSILSLLDAQRCVWTPFYPGGECNWNTGCGKEMYYDCGVPDFKNQPFCPCCGLKIEVKDA